MRPSENLFVGIEFWCQPGGVLVQRACWKTLISSLSESHSEAWAIAQVAYKCLVWVVPRHIHVCTITGFHLGNGRGWLPSSLGTHLPSLELLEKVRQPENLAHTIVVVRLALWSGDIKVISLWRSFHLKVFFWNKKSIELHVGWAAVSECVRAPVCETVMKVEWNSRLTQPSLRECVIWAWQWHNGIFHVNYRDLVHCKSERGISGISKK